jgi:GDPmannose 4,6-dehydratase
VALEDETHRFWRIRGILKDINLHAGSMESYASLFNIILKIKPSEVYHLAAQSYVGYSFEDEFSTLNININGTHYLLSAVKEFAASKVKFYFAGSSEMFGKVKAIPQNENTIFNPRSAYGISKVTGYHLVKNYREAYKLHASNGILFNHESPRRGFEFVTRKISHAAARIKKGSEEKLKLGNINAKRDWGHAKDYVEAMWLMLQKDNPEDYVIGTGKEHSVEDFAKKAFAHVGLNYKDHIVIDKQLMRPAEVDTLLADYTKAKKNLNWEPKISFDDLVVAMVENDLKNIFK